MLKLHFDDKNMPEEITLHQVFIVFQEPDNCRADYVACLADFTNYDGLVAANNPINAINVDIRSYCFDHVRVREELYRFIDNVRSSLWARCEPVPDRYSIRTTSNDVVGGLAQEPISEVTYVIDILK